MNVLIKKCYLVPIREALKLQSVSYSNKWPDDKWVIMNGLRRFGSWWQSQLVRMDTFCCRLPELYPNMPPPVNPDSTFETITQNLQPAAIKYWSARGFCTVRKQIVTIQAMEWHIKTHEFIMQSTRSSIAAVKTYLERTLLDDDSLPSAAALPTKETRTGDDQGGQISLGSSESCAETDKSLGHQTQSSETPGK